MTLRKTHTKHYLKQNKQDTKQCTQALHQVPESEYLTGGERSQNVMMSGMEFDDEGTEKTGPRNTLSVCWLQKL